MYSAVCYVSGNWLLHCLQVWSILRVYCRVLAALGKSHRKTCTLYSGIAQIGGGGAPEYPCPRVPVWVRGGGGGGDRYLGNAWIEGASFSVGLSKAKSTRWYQSTFKSVFASTFILQNLGKWNFDQSIWWMLCAFQEFDALQWVWMVYTLDWLTNQSSCRYRALPSFLSLYFLCHCHWMGLNGLDCLTG